MSSTELPSGWKAELERTGDLDTAYKSLSTCHGFYPEGMRGRISSLMLDLERAEGHFAKATNLVREIRDLDESIRRTLLVESFHIENDLLRGKVTRADMNPALPEALLRVDQEVARYISRSLSIRALVRLYFGKDALAISLFDRATETSGRAEAQGICHTGKACAYYNLGLHDDCSRSMENAELCFGLTENKLNRAALAAQLISSYSFLGEVAKSREWRANLEIQALPDHVKSAFLHRTDLVLKRSKKKGRMFVV